MGIRGYMNNQETLPVNFEDLIKTQSKPILVDFWAEWCPPCKMMNPILSKLAGEWKEKIMIIKINTDEKPYISARYGITSIPTMILFKNGAEVKRTVGAMSLENLKKTLEGYL